MEDEVFELVDEAVFDDNMDHALAVVWWLTHLLGGKVVFPTDEEFWNTNAPEVTRLVLRKENNQLVLVAEKQEWVGPPKMD